MLQSMGSQIDMTEQLNSADEEDIKIKDICSLEEKLDSIFYKYRRYFCQ